MKQFLPILLKDFYKVGHPFQYPSDTTMVYSNFTPRKSRVDGIDGVVAFGMQYFVEEYLVRQFNENFFAQNKYDVVQEYSRVITSALGPGTSVQHLSDLHDLGYLPLKVKAVPEGTIVPFRVPILTIRNTNPKFFWLTNMLETLMSNVLWQPMTSATTALRYRREFEKYAELTGADKSFIQWQGHDFSFRGMAGVEAAILSAAGHLLSFTGTDTIPALLFLEEYYGANLSNELIGGSVPATEHSVMSMGLKSGELESFRRLIEVVYPTGIVSIVSDTWDFWRVLTDYLPALRDTILGRYGKLVIRPDSGDPVKIICGDHLAKTPHEMKGAIEVLWDTFGGTVNEKGYKVLDPHIGLIYGDSITPERQHEILSRLAMKGFASSNVVLGIGSYTYQYVTRDTYGFAMKATYGEVNGVGQTIFKEPKTDDGTKNSAKGLLSVHHGFPLDNGGDLKVSEDCTWDQEDLGLLQTIFEDGLVSNLTTLKAIRERLEGQR